MIWLRDSDNIVVHREARISRAQGCTRATSLEPCSHASLCPAHRDTRLALFELGTIIKNEYIERLYKEVQKSLCNMQRAT